MIRFYSRIPAAALRRYFDGHTYALIPHFMDVHGAGNSKIAIRENYDAPRLVNADNARIEGGEAWVYFGQCGEAIAPTWMPSGVSAEHDK